MKGFVIFFIIAMELFIITGCKSKPTQAVLSSTNVVETVKAQITQYAIQTALAPKPPTNTPEPLPTEPMPTLIPSEAATAAPQFTPTKTPDMTGATIYVSMPLSATMQQVTIVFPNIADRQAIPGEHIGIIDGKMFDCGKLYLSKMQCRFICLGPILEPGKTVKVNIYKKNSTISIFEGKVGVPFHTSE